MDLKCINPQDLIKISSSISLILTEKYDCDELNIIKNLLCSITNNLSCYFTQNSYYKNKKDKK